MIMCTGSESVSEVNTVYQSMYCQFLRVCIYVCVCVCERERERERERVRVRVREVKETMAGAICREAYC